MSYRVYPQLADPDFSSEADSIHLAFDTPAGG